MSSSDDLSRSPTDRLRQFASLLLRWNATLNLVAARDETTLWERHITDCLQLVPLLPPKLERAIDLGTGGGFPGLVLAIATSVPFDLIEADQRKSSFLRTAILETRAPATVHCCRAEVATVPPARLVTARALAPLPRLLPLAERLLVPGGVGLFMKGAKAADEMTAAEADWNMEVDPVPSRTNPDGVILRITGLRRR